jgi:hypothetical protein
MNHSPLLKGACIMTTIELDFYDRVIVLNALAKSLVASREHLVWLQENPEYCGEFSLANAEFTIESTETIVHNTVAGNKTLLENLDFYLGKTLEFQS